MSHIHYLGPEETFAEQAAKSFASASGLALTLHPAKTLEQAIRLAGEDDYAVVPYYNLYEGLIQETVDLIMEHRLTICAAGRVAIRFALGGYEPFDAIHSHPKALAQCSEHLRQEYPDLRHHETASTAAAVEWVAQNRRGLAVGRREAFMKHGVPVLRDDIGNRQYGRGNYTEFLFTGRRAISFPDSRRLRTMIAVMPNVDRAGLLAGILGQIAFFGINLVKIHSRPALSAYETDNDPQMFYLEMETRIRSEEFRLCRDSLNLRLSPPEGNPDGIKSVHLLGEYPSLDFE